MEPFVYLALFLFVAVISLVFRWLKAQIEEAPTDQLQSGPWPTPHRPAKVISGKPPAATREAARPRPPSLSSHPPPLPRRPVARLAAGKSVQDLRRGILWMTILGRCRGLEPPGRIAGTGTHLD